MTNVTYNVKYPMLGTSKQQAAKILMRFTLDIDVNGTTVVSLRDMTLRAKNDGGYFFSSESRKYTNKEGAEKYSNYAVVFPNPADRERQDQITQKVVEAYEKLKAENPATSAQPQTTANTSNSSNAAW